MQGPTRISKRARLQALFSRAFRPGQPIVSDTAGFSSTTTNTGTSFFSNSHDLVFNNTTLIAQGERDIITVGMKALSKRIIDGAEYDSSARDPPPQCHPGTRVELLRKINVWFQDTKRQKALLWLNGPAGVGKSAVMQTFAESLAESKSLGAALFFSKLNDRNDPQRVFTTLAFQLATRIPAYRAHIMEQIALDPSLLKKAMKEQFRVFIVEPFGHQKIGKKGRAWGVLLDGLDECDGVEEQCNIVQLISEFVLNFPHAPLVWAIASRPEPHIVNTFTDEVIAPHWSEYIPIDSTEACRDVESYLSSRFKAIRKRFAHVPSDWPSETQFLKLSHGALGLFVFAKTAVRFMEDSDHANPVSRLNLLLSVIDRVGMTGDNPFAFLDALYTQIVASVPPTVWQTTKQILGFVIWSQIGTSNVKFLSGFRSRSLTALSIFLNLDQTVVYSALHKLHSVLEIPRSKHAHKSGIRFFHASFLNYLSSPTRSKAFFIDLYASAYDAVHRLYKIYINKPWDTNWAEYTHLLPRTERSNFLQKMKRDVENSVFHVITGVSKTGTARGPFVSSEDRSECLDALIQVNLAEIIQTFLTNDPDGPWKTYNVSKFLLDLWNHFPEELRSGGLCKEVLLQDLNFDHLDCGKNKPSCAFYVGRDNVYQKFNPHSSQTLQEFLTRLIEIQQQSPRKGVVVFGDSPEKRNAFFKYEDSLLENQYYYFIPYPC